MFQRAPGTSALIVFDARVRDRRGDDRLRVCRSRAVPRLAGRRHLEGRVDLRVATRTDRIPRAASRLRISSTTARARTTLEQLSAMRDGRAALIRERAVADAAVGLRDRQRVRGDGTARRSRAACSRPATIAAGAAPVAVLAHHYWRDEMAAGADAIGRTLQIGREHLHDGRRAVARHRVRQHRRDRCLAAADAESRRLRATPANLRFIGAAAGRRHVRSGGGGNGGDRRRAGDEYPATNGGWSVRLVPVSEIIGGDGFWVVIALFMLSIGLLMAIATANVSNLVHGAHAGARARAGGSHRARRAQGPLDPPVRHRGPAAVGDRGRAVAAARVGGAAGDRRGLAGSRSSGSCGSTGTSSCSSRCSR